MDLLIRNNLDLMVIYKYYIHETIYDNRDLFQDNFYIMFVLRKTYETIYKQLLRKIKEQNMFVKIIKNHHFTKHSILEDIEYEAINILENNEF